MIITKFRALTLAAALGLGLGFGLTSSPQPAQAQFGIYVGHPGYGYHGGWRHRDRYWGPRRHWGYRDCIRRRPIYNRRGRVIGWRRVNVCR